MSDVTTMRGAKNLSVTMRLMRDVTQVKVAESIALSDSALGDWIAKGHLQRACAVIAASGGKVVSADEKTMPPDEIAAYKTLARMAMDMDGPVSDFGTLAE